MMALGPSGFPQWLMNVAVQAIFLHDRLIAAALEDHERERLWADVARRKLAGYSDDALTHVGAYEDIVGRLLVSSAELDVAIVSEELQPGQLVTLSQNFYFRRINEERGAFRGWLDVDRTIRLHGRFSISRLIGATGKSETFGHRRFTMLAYVQDLDLASSPPTIELRPMFIGWRMVAREAIAAHDDRREIWPQQCDQFEAIAGKRATATDRAAVALLSEEQVKNAFASIIGEPFVPKDWGGETSDLYTTRLTIEQEPVAAAFAFKGPALKGTLHPTGMGKRGDQGLRLAHEPADLMVVQHHGPIAAEVRNLMSALARSTGKRFMVIDGETTAIILATYGRRPDVTSPGTDVARVIE